MQNKVKLSVIIVNWNACELLRDCLQSVFTHSGALNLQVFVVDNNSADSSVEMVQIQFPAVKLIANTRNLGFSKANNQALREMRSDYALLLNPDTVIMDSALEKMVNFLDSHPQVGVVGPKLINPDGSLQLGCRRSIPTPKVAFYRLSGLSLLFPNNPEMARYNLTNLDPDATCEVEAVSGSCMMVRREAMDQVGLLDERFFMYGEDLDWCYRIEQAGWKIFYLPSAQIMHHHRASSRQRKVRSTIEFYKAMYLFHQKHFADRTFFLLNWLIVVGILFRAVLVLFLVVLPLKHNWRMA
jgi:N-acetylglucosaminyl-diphospho-decaprenol L-rhamnosyltransferase